MSTPRNSTSTTPICPANENSNGWTKRTWFFAGIFLGLWLGAAIMMMGT